MPPFSQGFRGRRVDDESQDAQWPDMTAALRRCQSCGAVRPVAEHRVYQGAGTVLRCPACDQVALVAAELRDGPLVHFDGAWWVELPRP